MTLNAVKKTCVLWLSLVGWLQASSAAAPQAPVPNVATLSYGLKAYPLGGGWHLIPGANDDFSRANGCNIINTGFLVANGQVVVVNTGVSRRYGEQQRALIDAVSGGLPIKQVLALNLHPDYFMGNQAYSANTLTATALTRTGIQAEGKAYEDNLFRLCGDWMSGTQTVVPAQPMDAAQTRDLVGRPVKVLELKGHTASDLVIHDPDTGVLWAGGLVFYNRIVTTPHADLKPWMDSLETLKRLSPRWVIPSHGTLTQGTVAIDQTLDYLKWLDRTLTDAAAQGLEMNEVMQAGAPERFRQFAAYPAEFYRNVTTLYPRYEKAAIGVFR